VHGSVFHDASGRRRRWVVTATTLLLALIVAMLGVFAYTIVGDTAPPAPEFDSADVPGADAKMDAFARKVGGYLRHRGPWLPGGKPKGEWRPLTVGFYTADDASSVGELRAKVNSLDWLSPNDFHLLGPTHTLTQSPDKPLASVMAAADRKPRLMPIVQNAVNGQWDATNTAALLASKPARTKLLDQLVPMLDRYGAKGAVFDFEDLPQQAQPQYRAFLAEAATRFHTRGWLVAAAVPVADPGFDLKGFAAATDHLILMAYDEHWATGTPGPIASQPWFAASVRRAVAQVGRDKAIVAIGNYAYDWAEGAKAAEPRTVEEAWTIEHDDPDATLRFDPESGNTRLRYMSDDGRAREVWILDAASAYNQVTALRSVAPAGLAVWRLGSEDPGFWDAVAAGKAGRKPDLTRLKTNTNVDIEGQGELIRVRDVPAEGRRTLSWGADGLIHGESFQSLPTPYVVERAGLKPGYVALTFDDGPDPRWTPPILDILKREGVPATFFVIGEHAIMEPGLMRRLVAEGHEIGNHSYTHPNFATEGPASIRFQLSAAQRVIQAYTGRSTSLFRAPYFGDAEPSTVAELTPALLAQKQGYLNVGLHVDPADWKRPGTQAIIDRTIAGVSDPTLGDRYGQVVLLHDSGGDRAQTVEALAPLIRQLQAKGYRFVTVSQLVGMSRAEMNPPVSAEDVMAVAADRHIFATYAAAVGVLHVLFFAAIALGLARALTLSALALRARAAERDAPPPPAPYSGLVSVLIPAFNEARVIAESVRRVLGSTDVELEVIVIDDGSKDDTSAIVARAFGDDPRVRLLTLPNGGKARALNRGLALARGQVIVALDADTQFERETIARLARWFADPELAAVAGNAKVGNRVNLVTRWQATEYVTAQNLERRALSGLNAITVVPGAVGAWRADALRLLGGYPADTLAEDQDLTIAVQRAGWRVTHDPDAIAWTEAPDTLNGLARQRFRWAYGTLQCLWKHRGILRTGRPAGLARIGLPQAWAFQIGFGLVSPLIDLALAFSLVVTAIEVRQHGLATMSGDLWRMLAYWLAFTAVDCACGWLAFRLDGRERFRPLTLLSQRFVYRQIMYWVVIRAVKSALTGPLVGWGKLERSGGVALA
jgi:peptidoglycan/xylan/chitin deacetylase (PgdA/CDA1 family)/spore germination protein YaaH